MIIEKGIPIPCRSMPKPYKEIAALMYVGDSVGDLTERQRNALCAAIKEAYAPTFTYCCDTQKDNNWERRGFFASRKMPDGKFRVWRIE